jgi:hypothetical protein
MKLFMLPQVKKPDHFAHKIKTRYIYINSFRLGKIFSPFDYPTNYVQLNMSLVFTLVGYILPWVNQHPHWWNHG